MSDTAAGGGHTSPSVRSRVIGYVKLILFTMVVAFLLKTFVVEAFRIPSGSMENTLLVGDFLLVNKLAYGVKTPRYIPLTNVAIPSFTLPLFGGIRRGDVVVFEFPGTHDEVDMEGPVYYIKRCVGLPGDTVLIQSGRVRVNGREVLLPAHAKSSLLASHPWGSANATSVGGSIDWNNYGPTIVPKRGDVIDLTPASLRHWKEFVEREHHHVQVDSNGVVSVDGVETKRYTVRGNYCFVLGDNRGNSLDSRSWGFVPEDYIIGEALVIYWSRDPENPGNEMNEGGSSIRWARIGTLIR